MVFLADVPTQKIHCDDVRDVSDGYARNFLFPRKLAVPATAHTLEQVKHRAATQQYSQQQARGLLEKTATKLRGLTLEFTAKAHEGKLYGGIHVQQILEELKKRGVVLAQKQLKLEHPLKMIGEHRVVVKLGDGVEGEVKIRVSEEISNS